MYTIKLNTEQLYLIKQSLEVMSRLKSGQISIAMSEVYPQLSWDDREDIEKEVRSRVFPELSPSSYYGVGSKIEEISDCFDMIQVIRHRLSWDRLAAEGKDKPDFYGRNYDTPMKFGKHDLIEVENEIYKKTN